MRVTVYFDLETGGLLPKHPNIQLAAVAIDDDTGDERGTFERKIQFDPAECEPDALKMNHYSAAEWANAAPPVEVCDEFRQFLARNACVPRMSAKGNEYSVAKLYGHNAATFDGPRLRAMFKHHGVFLPADMLIRCTIQRALFWCDEHQKWPPDNYRLTTLCEYFGVPTAGAHDALADVRMNARLARHIMHLKGTDHAAPVAG